MKKHTYRPNAAALLALVMALGLTACGNEGGDATTAEMTPAQVMEKSQEVMAEVKSLHYDMDMSFGMSMQEQSMNVESNMSVDYILDPMAMKMDMHMTLGEMGDQDMTTYLVTEDGAAVMYIKDQTGVWTKTPVGDMSTLDQYNATASMDLYLSSTENFTENGTETINGKEAVRYDGVIAKDDMEEVLEASGMLDQLEQLNLGSSTAMISELGDLPVSVWIEKETYYPVRYDMDMTELMKKMFDQMGGAEMGLTLSDVKVSMVMSQMNEIGDITLPDEAKAAA